MQVDRNHEILIHENPGLVRVTWQPHLAAVYLKWFSEYDEGNGVRDAVLTALAWVGEHQVAHWIADVSTSPHGLSDADYAWVSGPEFRDAVLASPLRKFVLIPPLPETGQDTRWVADWQANTLAKFGPAIAAQVCGDLGDTERFLLGDEAALLARWQQGAGFLQVQGCALEWASFGPKPQSSAQAQPTIVILHEGLGCVALWRDFPAKLSQATGLPVLAFSRAGYGQSDPADMPRPLDYLTREATRVLPQVLAQLGVGPLILLGHSDGATIAAEYAGRHCDPRLRGLVLMAPHFFTEAYSRDAIEEARQVFETQDLKTRMAKYHRDPEATFRGWNDTWLHPDFQAWNVAEVIDRFAVPALALQGKQDQYGSDEQVLVVQRRSPSPVQLALLDDCRHVPFLEQPEVTLATIQTFVKGLASGSSALQRTPADC